ncbi:MAG TPA: hypothetical protein VGF28_16585 [Thermoanaerobaculia bacterium]|jgi:plastocyanin
MPDFSISIIPNPGGGALFEPNSLPAPNFTGVSWNNTTELPHQIRLSDGSWETQQILPGEGSSPLYVVDGTEGSTIAYDCALHPDEVGSIYVSAVENLNA